MVHEIKHVDEEGRWLYFLASTDYGPRTGWLEMSSLDRPVRRAIYLAVLSASEPSPLLPETGDEPRNEAREETARILATFEIDDEGALELGFSENHDTTPRIVSVSDE